MSPTFMYFFFFFGKIAIMEFSHSDWFVSSNISLFFHRFVVLDVNFCCQPIRVDTFARGKIAKKAYLLSFVHLNIFDKQKIIVRCG